MSDNSGIEWTDATWNPVTGCTKVSPGCKNCYAERLARRLKLMGNKRYRDGFSLTLQPDQIGLPLRWRHPRMIFVNSMSDLFHEMVPLDFIKKVFNMMAEARWHTFQVLTKRAKRLVDLAPHIVWPENVWQGVSVESSQYSWRIEYLRKVPAAVRFISAEPLLGPLDHLDLTGIHWVIAGGESGPQRRLVNADWIRLLRKQCVASRVPFFFKQWGGRTPKSAGRVLDGRTWDGMPVQRHARKVISVKKTGYTSEIEPDGVSAL